jgi:DNA-binding beta-propeller fold protein YncE
LTQGEVTMLRHVLPRFLAIAVAAAAALAATAAPPDYRIVKRYPIGGTDTFYDYVRLDPQSRQLFVAHGNRVEVLDADSGAKRGEISGMHGVHGIEIIAGENIGFTSNGLDRTVTKFDLKTLQPLKVIKYLGLKPDALQYDPDTQKLFVVNGAATGDVTVIEPKTGAIVDTVGLGGGKLEQIAFDNAGRAFVNDEERSVIHVFDTHTLKPLAVWPLSPGEAPTGMAIDTAHHRLFSACGNDRLVVLDSGTGKIVATPAIGSDPDGAAYDTSSGRIFTSNYDGTLTVLHEDSPDHYTLLQTVKTERGARTLALDPQTGSIFLPSAKVAADGRTIVPATFELLVVAQSQASR